MAGDPLAQGEQADGVGIAQDVLLQGAGGGGAHHGRGRGRGLAHLHVESAPTGPLQGGGGLAHLHDHEGLDFTPAGRIEG